jgi:hypothetical protein
MRTRSAATALAALTAGVTAAVALHRRADRRPIAPAAPPVAVPDLLLDTDAVVLPFVRPAVPAASVEQAPARCGDSGGRTKAGAPCGARATSTGRCHHHPIAA